MKTLKKAAAASLGTLFAWMIAGVASAQTTASTTPGAPDTGMGGDLATNLILLAITGAVAVAGLFYLSRRMAQS
ncbi:MAG TPA: hypothetical protein VG934_00375 [Candidatus Paceibacterota bacterium]|nr:hypothetical protein [Candidatus Paceibacterota bacterium]